VIPDRVRALLGKELRQLRRSRSAVISSTILPIVLLVVTPLGQLSAIRSDPAGLAELQQVPLAGLAEFRDPADFFLWVLFPLFLTLGGLVVPSMAATYTIIAERERRSLELLMALPVSVQDILLAKLLAMLALAGATVLPLFLIDAAALAIMGLASVGYLLLLALVLASSLTFAVGVGLLLALLARDLRTANNVNGALVGPLLPIVLGVLFAVPGPGRLVVLAGLLLTAAGVAFLVGLRWLTFERYVG
jgi:ABC-2 type transport system permease protein